jgi:anaphase-promoting complex subunit 3
VCNAAIPFYTSNRLITAFSASRIAHAFPEEAALRCRAGNMALKGNLSDKASKSYREALSSNPYLWEAFEGLCSLGSYFINWFTVVIFTQNPLFRHYT